MDAIHADLQMEHSKSLRPALGLALIRSTNSAIKHAVQANITLQTKNNA
jgi:hypothetical protein